MTQRSTYRHSQVIHRPLLRGVKSGAFRNINSHPLPWYIEYSYYFFIFYDTAGDLLPFEIPFLNSAMLLPLAVFCVQRLRSQRKILYGALALPLAFAFSYLIIQLAVHNESLGHPYVRPFVSWIVILILTQSLCLQPGFLHRFARVIFIIGLTVLPFIDLQAHSVVVDRAGIDRSVATSFSNPNALAYWFGFCAVYFITATIENKRALVRIICSLIAVGCVGVVGLTVSRGTLLAVGAGFIVAMRRLLKRGVWPLFLAFALAGVSYESGVFDKIASSYLARGTEETGRSLVWPLAIERFFDSPLVGFGASDGGIYVPEKERIITPHNPFLFISLASGFVPLALFVAYCWCAILGSIRSSNEQTATSSFLLPLLAYDFVMMQASNLLFFLPFVTAPLSLAMLGGVSRRKRRLVLRRANIVRQLKPSVQPREAGHNFRL